MVFALVGCSTEIDQVIESHRMTEPAATQPTAVENRTIAPLTSDDSIIDCSGWAEGAKTYLRQQGRLSDGELIYGVGTFACGLPDSEFGSEFIESFLLTDQGWAANGLVAGPDLPFFTTAPCTTGDRIICPATVLNFADETELTGFVIIFVKDGELIWQFDELN